MFNHLWRKSLEAEGDNQTDHDDARPEQYRTNGNAIVGDKDDKDDEEDDEEDKAVDDDEELEKVRSP